VCKQKQIEKKTNQNKSKKAEKTRKNPKKNIRIQRKNTYHGSAGPEAGVKGYRGLCGSVCM
jgi:hypothetical protein